MSEQDPVNRRQFFRGMTGGLFRAIGELSGLDKLIEEESAPMVNLTEDDVLVDPEVQANSLSQIFSFLEQQSAMTGEDELRPEVDEPVPTEPGQLLAAQIELPSRELLAIDEDPPPGGMLDADLPPTARTVEAADAPEETEAPTETEIEAQTEPEAERG
ncbi:MAG TPA: hypothetical protein VIC57_00340 [Candidatus Dormibacteraeota bacterium]